MHSKQPPKFTCDLEGKVALVTGASGGIGAHLAMTLAGAGARVAVGARRRAPLADLVERIGSAGGRAIAVSLDVIDERSIEEALQKAASALGTVDVLLNNAGIAIPKPALEITVEEWDAVLATNLRGAFLVAQRFARRLVAARSPGCIINVGSIMGERVAGSLASYAASKAGLLQLTKALALEWARHRIRVNAIAPGYIETEINAGFFSSPAGEAMIKRIPQRRVGVLEDLDAPVLFLASDASSYVTGAVVPVDGGHLVSTL